VIHNDSIRERVSDTSGDETLRAAIYARTSDTTRSQGYSLDAQVTRSLDHCENLGWDVAFIYRDESESGANTDRPMFEEMIETAKRGVFDVIVFWKLDRFSRSLIHAVELESDLREFDVYLYSVTEQIDTTSATGRFNFRNLASAAEFERDMIKERTQLGLNQLAEEHKWPNETTPLGYSLTDESRITIDDTERQIVERIFESYLDLKSMPEVATKLNQDGVTTSDDGEWTARAIGDILRNEIYRGWYELGDIAEHVPEYQLIDDNTFEQVTKLRMRFQDSNANQQPMPTSRKDVHISEIRDKYINYLEMHNR